MGHIAVLCATTRSNVMIYIDEYSHGCCVKPTTLTEHRAVIDYIKGNLYQTDKVYDKRSGQYTVEHKATFAASTSDRSEYRFMLSDLKPLLAFLEFNLPYTPTITRTKRPTVEGVPIDINMHIKYTPRGDEQAAAVKHALVPDKPIRVLHAATGFGKTFCGYWTIAHTKVRTGLVMEPTHINTWLIDAEEYCTITKRDILVIKGSDSLRTLMEMQQIGALDAKMIFFSAATMRNYIKAYEDKTEPFPYDIEPDKLFEYLGIGLIIKDESHESIHSLCKQTIYTHTKKILFLSATLVSDNAFINQMYRKVFPKDDVWESIPNKHIDFFAYFYRSSPSAKIKYKGFRGYSHIAYESSILKNVKLKEEYWGLIRDVLFESFLDNYLQGTKAILFCSTKKMCTFLSGKAKAEFPNMTIGCFIGGSAQEELYDRDIIFSTPKSAGTGKNIPNLAVAWNTVAIGSTQLHRQIAGRLRPIALHKEIAPRFYMLYNSTIPQHIGYEKGKRIDSMGRAKSYKKIESGRVIGSK